MLGLEQIASFATILAFFAYLFVEWPKIQSRWKESSQTWLLLLMILSAILVLGSLPIMFVALLVNGPIVLHLLSSGILLIGTGFMLIYWIDNRTFLYKRSAEMSDIWIYIFAAFIAGILGVASALLFP